MNNSEKPTFKYERTYWSQGRTRVAGIDEAGRGALAGPVVAAVVILPANSNEIDFADIDDSKRLSAKKRATLIRKITTLAQAYSFGCVNNKKVDEIGVLKATFLAIDISLKRLQVQPEHLLIDYLELNSNCWQNRQTNLLKGDRKSISIAAASIIAKVIRDYVTTHILHQIDSRYNFNKHKGYGTAEHISLLKKFGYCKLHRTSFAPVAQQKFKN